MLFNENITSAQRLDDYHLHPHNCLGVRLVFEDDWKVIGDVAQCDVIDHKCPPASAWSRTARMVLTSSRAASSLSSTATRAEGPIDSLTKSILRACSSGVLNGWSYDTFARSRRNQPLVPLP